MQLLALQFGTILEVILLFTKIYYDLLNDSTRPGPLSAFKKRTMHYKCMTLTVWLLEVILLIHQYSSL